MAQNSKKIKYSLHIKPTPSPTLNEAGDIGVNSNDDNRLHYNRGTGAQRILLAEDALNPAFSDATNISYDPSTSTLTATDVQVAIDEVASVAFTAESKAEGAQDTIDNHMNNMDGAHSATAISIASIINLSASDVQAALEEHQSAIESKAEASDVYTKNETDNLLDDKADADDVYTKLEVDNALFLKADQIDLDSHTSATAMVHGVISKLVGETDTQTLTNKTIQGASIESPTRSDVKQDTKANLVSYAATPATNGQIVFATDEKKMYQIIDGELKAIGGGGGSGGINFMPMNAQWSPDLTDNVDAESSVGNWVTYADAADSVPVDMTGGTASQVTLTRTTVSGEVLNGQASFKISKSAANAQGEGASSTFHVPSGYSGQRSKISIPFRILSGSLVQGDVKVFIYNVTDSVLITPDNNDMLVGPNIEAYFDIPQRDTDTEMRLGFHFASTSASGLTFVYDDVIVGPADIAPSSVVTKAQEYTPDSAINQGIGTLTNVRLRHRLVGEYMEIDGNVTLGTVTSSQARLAIPNGFLIDTGTGAADKQIGTYFRDSSSGNKGGAIIGVDGAGYLCFGSAATFGSPTVSALAKATGDNISGGSEVISINAKFKVKNISNATLTQADTFWLSSVLASGTRVTGRAPNKLGEWTSELRNSSALTYTETNATPSVLPSAGKIRIYAGNAWDAADSNGEPTRMSFYIGHGNVAKVVSKGVDITPSYDGTNNRNQGYIVDTDPETGVLTVTAIRTGQGSSPHISGISKDGGSAVSDIDFDVLISPKASPMAIVENPVAYIKDVKTANTVGGTATSGSFQTRTLNTLEGDSWFVTLSSNQFTLPPGTYDVDAIAPAGDAVVRHKAKLRNITDSSDTIIGLSAVSLANGMSNSVIKGRFTINKPTTFEIQHRVGTTQNDRGFGFESNFGVPEVYTQVRIEKVR